MCAVLYPQGRLGPWLTGSCAPAEHAALPAAPSCPQSFMLRATALLPHTRYSESEWRSFAQLSAHQETSSAFAVTGGTTLELTLAQYWSRQACTAPWVRMVQQESWWRIGYW